MPKEHGYNISAEIALFGSFHPERLDFVWNWLEQLELAEILIETFSGGVPFRKMPNPVRSGQNKTELTTLVWGKLIWHALEKKRILN